MKVIKLLGFTIVLSLLGPSVCAKNLVLVVNKEHPIDNLSKSELVDIYMGRFMTFPDGSSVQPIDLDSEVKNQFYLKLVNQNERKINAYWSRLLFSGRAKPPKSIESVQEVLQYMAEIDDGIAYIPEDEVTQSLKVVYKLESNP